MGCKVCISKIKPKFPFRQKKPKFLSLFKEDLCCPMSLSMLFSYEVDGIEAIRFKNHIFQASIADKMTSFMNGIEAIQFKITFFNLALLIN